jgi:hypothetical protein
VHCAISQRVFDRWNRQRAELGLFTFDPTRTYHMRGVPDEQIGIEVDCRPVAGRIVAGLRQHRSQLHVMSDDPDDVATWERRVGREWGVVVWPPRPPSADRLPDLFADLPGTQDDQET